MIPISEENKFGMGGYFGHMAVAIISIDLSVIVMVFSTLKEEACHLYDEMMKRGLALSSAFR